MEISSFWGAGEGGIQRLLPQYAFFLFFKRNHIWLAHKSHRIVNNNPSVNRKLRFIMDCDFYFKKVTGM
jgi:hypothetical protein